MLRIVFQVPMFLVAVFLVGATAGADTIESLRQFLEQPAKARPSLEDQGFAQEPLTKEQALRAKELIWSDYVERTKVERAEEVEKKSITIGEFVLKYDYKIFGDKPEDGSSLFISMHGGGGTAARVNDQQWQNQKRLYEPEEGVYLAPRAPCNKWNLWHRSHIDPMFDRLITNMVLFEDVNPNKVYLMGYSAGGDGVYQLAPRMADRWAAAAMMAGHPNGVSPQGLRNLPFTIHMGAKDSAYKRNKIAAQWKEKLGALHDADPDGYTHLVKIYPEKGHWMDREDATAVPWMMQYKRKSYPSKVVWRQSGVTHDRFYWLAVPAGKVVKDTVIRAVVDGQHINVESDVPKVIVQLNDELIDLDKEIKVTAGDTILMTGVAKRTIATIERTLTERGDPGMWFSAAVELELETDGTDK